ncbi:hypothetical protein QUF90_21410 [Desulfococcaceae bacterium HSG9]|nr:hypothetical protein [Desulfococcaceae bacterium HSG9]
MKITQRSDYTFKYNKKLGRHGWLRLTPAYSVKLVTEIIDNIPEDAFILRGTSYRYRWAKCRRRLVMI